MRRLRPHTLGITLMLVACNGRGSSCGSSSKVADASPSDASLVVDAASVLSERREQRAQSVADACKELLLPEAATAAGYALLAEGKRAEALRALHDAVRPPGTLPVGATSIDDGLPPGYRAYPGPDGYAIASDRAREASYLFKKGVLVRRLRGPSDWIPGTSLIRVESGRRIEVLRAATGEVAFEAPVRDVFVARKGACAIVHTDCTGVQKVDVLYADGALRMPSITIDPENAVDPSDNSPFVGWVGDGYVWFRGERESVLIDIATGKPVPPPAGALENERDWGAIHPVLDLKHGVMIAYHEIGQESGLRTTLIDWPTRRVLRRSDSGPYATFNPGTLFNDTGDAFAVDNGPCEALLFRTGDLSLRRIPTSCGGEEGVTGLVDLRFWPRSDTLFVHESLRTSIRDVGSGSVLTDVPMSYFYASARFVAEGTAPDGAFVIDDCDADRGKQVRIRIDRTLRVGKSERPGKCTEPGWTDENKALLASLSAKMCTVETIPDALPREVCTALRAGNAR